MNGEHSSNGSNSTSTLSSAQDSEKYLEDNGIAGLIEKAIVELVQVRPTNPAEFLAKYFYGKAGGCTPTEMPPSPPERNFEKKKRRPHRQTISARACAVCGRDDRPGEQRQKGFKCFQCIGLPSNPKFVKEIELVRLKKGRDEDGQFVINDYTILESLGRGNFGKVRLCVHNLSNQSYAVKFLDKVSINRGRTILRGSQQKAKASPDKLQMAKAEVAIMCKLTHPNIIQIYGTMESETQLMIVMEYLEGGQIYPSTYPAEPVPLGTLQRYISGIARGLYYLHDQGVIHRDIKPENILLDSRKNVKLADFGISTMCDTDDEVKHEGFTGTPAFMPPEAFNASSMQEGEPTDVWAFGVTAYAMAFGTLPFSGKSLRDLSNSIQHDAIVLGHKNKPLDDLIGRMLCRSVPDRITVEQILTHPLLQTVRISKGHPVETLELELQWDGETSALKADRHREGEMGCGLQTYRDFFSSSSSVFQITQGNDYSITLYDTKRDPRRRLRPQTQGKKTPSGDVGEEGTPVTWELYKVHEDDWDDEDLDEDF